MKKLQWTALILCIAGASLVAGGLVRDYYNMRTSSKIVKAEVKQPLLKGIVRLYEEHSGTYCSGVVISPHFILTASHCVILDTGAPIFPIITIRAIDNIERNITAKIYGTFKGHDVSILTGDFSLFAPYAVATPAEAKEIKHAGSVLFACGFPGDIMLLCMPLRYLGDSYMTPGMWRTNNTLIPGMSGGPVLVDYKSNAYLVIGLSDAYYNDYDMSEVTPVYNLVTVERNK